jgi:GTP cyclohydrolase I
MYIKIQKRKSTLEESIKNYLEVLNEKDRKEFLKKTKKR